MVFGALPTPPRRAIAEIGRWLRKPSMALITIPVGRADNAGQLSRALRSGVFRPGHSQVPGLSSMQVDENTHRRVPAPLESSGEPKSPLFPGTVADFTFIQR